MPHQDILEDIEYKVPLLERIKTVLKFKQTWAIGLYSLFVFAPIPAFAALWGVPFLMSVYHLPSALAGTACAMIWLGMGLGSLVAGWISERMGSRKKPLVVSAGIGVIATIMILYTHLSVTSLFVWLFLFGVGTSGQSLSFNVVNDQINPNIIGTAMGFNNLMIVISGALFQPLVGWLLRLNWNGSIYQVHRFIQLMLIKLGCVCCKPFYAMIIG